MPDTPREILKQTTAEALSASYERCTAASTSTANGDTHVDESRKAIDRSRALLLRVASGTRLG